METSRSRRVGEQIQRELAYLIQREVKDPRVQWVTVAAVRVTRDFSHATVFFSVLNETEESVMNAGKGLEQAAGFLRRELGKRMSIRNIPQLHFKYDESQLTGERLSRLIDEAVETDRSHHQDSAGE